MAKTHYAIILITLVVAIGAISMIGTQPQKTAAGIATFEMKVQCPTSFPIKQPKTDPIPPNCMRAWKGSSISENWMCCNKYGEIISAPLI